MSSFQSDRPRRAFPIFVVLFVIILAAIGAAAWYFKPRFESDPPQITVMPTVDTIGLATPLEIVVSDAGTGLRSVRATLTAGAPRRRSRRKNMRSPRKRNASRSIPESSRASRKGRP
jgi:hypothetical protein